MKGISALVAAMLLLCAVAQAAPITYTAHLTGSTESPPNASPGTGSATVVLDVVAHTLSIDVVFSGLLGTTTASHIHCCTASPDTGVAIVATQTPFFTGFPIGVTSGTYSHTFDTLDNTTWSSNFLSANGGTASGAESALAAGLDTDTAYFNIHSTVFPGGEIRGFLAQPVPEPASLSLLTGALLGLLAARKRNL